MATASVTLSTPVPQDLADKAKLVARATHKNMATWLRDLVIKAVAENYRAAAAELAAETPDDDITLESFLG